MAPDDRRLGSPELPGFPVSALPEWSAKFVSAVAEETQTPPDLAAMLLLSVLAAILAKRAVVEVLPNWTEPLSLWTVVSLGSGNRKTTVLTRMTEPIRAFEDSWVTRSRSAVAIARAERRTQEAALARMEAELAKKEAQVAGEFPDVQALTLNRNEAAARLETTKAPISPRLLAEDSTPESLASLLADHAGRMAIFSDEGGPFEQMAGRYASNRAPNLEVYLKSDSASDIRVDRRGRPPEHVTAPALTFGLAVQPVVLQGLAGRPGFRGKGLLARFLYALPAETLGRRRINPAAVSPTTEAAYRSHLMALLDGSEVLLEPSFAPSRLVFSVNARRVLDEWRSDLEPRLGETGDLSAVSDWASKLPGKLARIAALIHVAGFPSLAEAAPREIGPFEVESAVAIGKYLLEHARAAFDEMDADPIRSHARAILRYVQAKGLDRFSKRDLQVALRARFPLASDLELPLRHLEDLGVIHRLEPLDPGIKAGRPPSPVFELETRHLDGDAHNAQNDSVRSVHEFRGAQRGGA